jgi:hypothetical protein
MFGRKKKDEEAVDIEMTQMGDTGRNGGPPDDTEYKPINWKKLFFSPKYIPWHILFILIAVATALLTIYHDEVVEVSFILQNERMSANAT